MISQEEFDEIEAEHNCGYWNECWEHACPCAIMVEDKGLRQDIWDEIKKEQREIAEELNEDDDYYEPMDRCKKCGNFVEARTLENGICMDCEDEERQELEDLEYEDYLKQNTKHE